jgi:hypothetical protein
LELEQEAAQKPAVWVRVPEEALQPAVWVLGQEEVQQPAAAPEPVD